DEPHDYYLVHYVDDPDSLFHIAASQLQQEFPQKPKWMTPPEGKPARHKVPGNTWLRKTADATVGSMGLPAGSEVVVSTEPPQMVNLNGGTTEFRKVQVFKAGSGTVKDSANQVMTNASKGATGWLAKSKMGAGLTAEPSIPVEFKDDAVVDRSANPIPVQAGEIIGHWGEHELATAGASGFEKDADSKAVHFEMFVAKNDKQALEDCINNKARVTGGQGYLLVKKEVTTYRLTNDSQHGFHGVANFGPQVLPLAVKESDIVTHGANNFVKVRERTAADGELAGEFVLQGSDVEVVSQHDWHKLGVKLVDGSSDPDGFLDKADTEGKEGGEFFSTLYDKLVTDKDNDGTLSGNDIKAALADEELAGKLRMLFIKHKSEWVNPGDWPRLKQELADQPELYEYAKQVHNNMAWMEDASEILGDTKPWFIHPAGMMGLIKDKYTECACDRDITIDELVQIAPKIDKKKLEVYLPEINDGFRSFNMSTCREKAHFLAQCYHESDGFMQTVEYGGARKEYSPWFGRGFIQITWQEIYAKYEEYAEEDFTSSDTAREKLEKFPHCIKSAFWFYNIYKNVSKYAKHDDFNMVVALINGGFNGYLDRLSKLNDIVSILSAQHLSSKIKDGVFPFSSSEIYNYRVYSYSWGRYHDPNLIGVKGTNKNSVEALNAYQRALTLYKLKNDKRNVAAIEKRIASLRDKIR
ncbi:TPA: glycoside hydrolase family 19 protein, partial [Aeromonas hydrophila]